MLVHLLANGASKSLSNNNKYFFARIGINKYKMSWFYQDTLITELPEDCVGYVYCITNLTNDRKYIGKKLSKFSKTTYKMVKLKNGTKKKKKIRSTIESDWQVYWSSSEELKQDVAKLGEDNFKREILYFCRSKSECSYIEAREQFTRRVLETDDYYNGIINCRINQAHIRKFFQTPSQDIINITDTQSE